MCTLLTVLAQICGDRMKMLLRDIFTNILDGVKVPNKVMSGYVDECILEMIKHSTFKSAIPSIVNEIINSKAKNLRERCLVTALFLSVPKCSLLTAFIAGLFERDRFNLGAAGQRVRPRV